MTSAITARGKLRQWQAVRGSDEGNGRVRQLAKLAKALGLLQEIRNASIKEDVGHPRCGT